MQVKNVEWLKQRTLHVKGLHPSDYKGVALEEKIKGHLEYTGANLLGVVMV